MLQTLLERLTAGEFETTIVVHGPNTQLSLKARVLAADQVGIIASVKGMMGGWSDPTAYPWTAISKINL